MAKKSQMMGMPQPIPHSGGMKQLKHNATRTSKASPMTASVIPHSGSKPGMPMASNDNIGAPYAKSSDRSFKPMTTQPTVIDHSPVAVPRQPKAFRNKKFSLGPGVMSKMPND